MQFTKGDELYLKLENSKRIYLCGKFIHPDIASSIQTEGLEIGVSQYKTYTAEQPHVHTWNHEYNFIIEGSVKVFIFSENKEYLLKSGDMYLIEPNMGYITKATDNTRVIFVKNPGGDDKKLLPVTEKIRKWMKGWEESMEDDR